MTRKTFGWIVAAGIAVVAVVVLTIFQPQKLFIDKSVDEALPAAQAAPLVAAPAQSESPAQPKSSEQPASPVPSSTSSAPASAAPDATAPPSAAAVAAPAQQTAEPAAAKPAPAKVAASNPARPTAAKPAPAQAAVAKPAPAQPAPVASRGGAFRSLEHKGSGQARLLKVGTGYVVRFEDLDVENGPDLYVYLSPASSDSKAAAFNQGHLDLGRLKGNKGNQNYAVPAGVDVTTYKSVVVWCKRFSAGFAVAPLA